MIQSQAAAPDIQGLAEDISRVFNIYRDAISDDSGVLECRDMGKLYELLVLSELIKELEGYGLNIKFPGETLRFKSAPGKIKQSDAHFNVCYPGTDDIIFHIFVDIEFNTFSSSSAQKKDLSSRHEIDIILTCLTDGYPNYNEIILGVECKSTPKFKKALLKEALGIRLELDPYRYDFEYWSKIQYNKKYLCLLKLGVPGYCLEHRLVSPDEAIRDYRQSPSTYGLKLQHVPIPKIVSCP